MNNCGDYLDTENELRQSWSRATSEIVVLYTFMQFPRSCNERGIRLRAASYFYDIPVGTSSNYIRHFVWSLRTVFSSDLHA